MEYKVKSGYLEPVINSNVKTPGAALVIKVFGLIILMVGVFIGVSMFLRSNDGRIGLFILLGSLLSGCLLYGFGQIIELLHFNNEKIYLLKDVEIQVISSDEKSI